MPRTCRPLLPLLLLLAWVPLRAQTPAPDAPAAQARRALHQIVDTDKTFIRIHAAEVLIAFGEGTAMQKQFASELPGSESSLIKIGVWRVLAETAPTSAEKAQWVAKIEHVTHLVGDTDRIRAIESLNKLRVEVTGSTLAMMQQLAQTGPDGDRAMPRWSLVLAHQPGALNNLAELLHSSSPQARQLAAYALRWLRIPDATIGRRLAKVANRESATSVAYPFLLSAGLTLRADEAHLGEWQRKVGRLAASGDDDARWEAVQAILPFTQAEEVPGLVAQLSDANSNTRTCVAWQILYVTTPRAP